MNIKNYEGKYLLSNGFNNNIFYSTTSNKVHIATQKLY